MNPVYFVHRYYTQGNLDFSMRFFSCYIQRVCLDMKTTTTTTMLCDKCKKNEVQIYNLCCNCCIPCNAMGRLRLGSKVVISIFRRLEKSYLFAILGEGK